MRAQFVFEKFTEEGDPVHDMDIGPRGIVYRCGECGSLLDAGYDRLPDGEEFELAKTILYTFGENSDHVKYVYCNSCRNEEEDRQAQEDYAREQERERERSEEEQRWREENEYR